MFSKYKKRFLPLFLLFFSLFFPILSVQAADSLTVHFLDVGQGLSVLVDGKGFDADSYFAYAEEMVLEQIRIAMEKKEG